LTYFCVFDVSVEEFGVGFGFRFRLGFRTGFRIGIGFGIVLVNVGYLDIAPKTAEYKSPKILKNQA
jgi:hypothetical protein